MKTKMLIRIAIIFLMFQGIVSAQIVNPARFVQIRAIDFEQQSIEVHNFGTADQLLSGWRFCSHDENQDREYSGAGALNGVMLGAGESMFLRYNNDASAANEININSLGNFATPLDTNGAYAIQFYFQTPFGVGANIADHIQLSLDGADNASADERSDEAQNGGVWTNQNEWIPVTLETTTVVLLDSSSDSELHGPDDYEIDPTDVILGDLNGDMVVNLLDVAPFVELISSGTFEPAADVNGDMVVNLLDVGPFIDLISGG